MPIDYDKTCFIMMPISEEGSDIREASDDVLDNIIAKAVKRIDKDVKCVRSDRIPTSTSATDDIIRLAVRSKYAIADLSDRNANVFYELGIRHARMNRTILLARKKEELPFDVYTHRTIFYKTDTQKDRRSLSAKIAEYMKEMKSDPVENDSPVLSIFPIYQPAPMNTDQFATASGHPSPRDRYGDAYQNAFWRLRDTLVAIGYVLLPSRSDEASHRLYSYKGNGKEKFLLVFELPALHADSVNDYASFLRGLINTAQFYRYRMHEGEEFKIVVYVHIKPEQESVLLAKLRAYRSDHIFTEDRIGDFHGVDSGWLSTLKNASIEIWDDSTVQALWKKALGRLASQTENKT